MIPCIPLQSINLLTGTADERYQFSQEFFRETHYPQVFHRYYNNKLVEKITEEDLFLEINQEHSQGNRIYTIFGSTGSGKSEFLCWLKDKHEILEKSRQIIRISRSELNPQILIKKCYSSLGLDIHDMIIDEEKWNLLVKKPVSIINQIIWTTLSSMFDTDEEIIPLTMLLRPIIEKNISDFAEQIHQGKIHSPLQVISFEEFNQVLGSTSIKHNIDYISLSDQLIKNLDYYLFQGYSMVTLLQQLSIHLKQLKIRPLLLIDDLVQSLNIYAADVLDHFLSLEEGNWDIVVGITPGVLREDEIKNRLIQRILNLDTIEDRVKKLWLSDESGSTFYSLSPEEATNYIEKYIHALKLRNGYRCSSECPHAHQCKSLLVDDTCSLEHLPLNNQALERIYLGIPEGKGTLRYMILHSKEILRFLIQGNGGSKVKQMEHYLLRDCYVDTDDRLIKFLAEMYANKSYDTVTLSAPLVQHFLPDWNEEEIMLPIKKVLHTEHSEDISNSISSPKKSITPVRNWIEGKKVNLHLLDPVRSGVATLIQDIVKSTQISRKFTSRPSASLQRSEVIQKLKYPILFKKRNIEHILLERSFHLLHLEGYQQRKIPERRNIFTHLANDYSIAKWVYQGEKLHEAWKKDIEKQLNMSLMEFSALFKMLISKWYDISTVSWLSHIPGPYNHDTLKDAESLFLDWFALRDNIVDYASLNQIKLDKSFEEYFLSLKFSSVLNKHSLNGVPLGGYLESVQVNLKEYKKNIEEAVILKAKTFGRILPLLSKDAKKYQTLLNIINRNYMQSFSFDELIVINKMDSCLKQEGIYNRYEQLSSENITLKELHQQWLHVSDELYQMLQEKTYSQISKPQIELELIYDEKVLFERIYQYQEQINLMKDYIKALSSMPLEMFEELREKECLIYQKDIINDWNEFTKNATLLLQGQRVTEVMIDSKEKWMKVRYHSWLKHWLKQKEHIKNIKNMIPALVNDRNYLIQGDNIEEVIQFLEEDSWIRPQLKKHIRTILLEGRTQLPFKQRQQIVKDLEKVVPKFTNILAMELTLRK